jgi:lipopolysaccharide biosynthesis glycosyltransferase
MEKQNHIEIAFAADSNYLVPATVFLKSLFENNKSNHLSVNLLYLKSLMNEKDLVFIENYVTEHGHSLRKLSVSDDDVKAYPAINHAISACLRLLLPKLLPLHVEKILYLDADIVILDDLLTLYETNITDFFIAAVRDSIDAYAKFNPNLQKHIDNLGLIPGNYYVNSGVLLMNITKMRKFNVVERFFDFASEHYQHLVWADQDIINAVLGGYIKYIQPKYNMNYMVEPDVAKEVWGKNEVSEAKKHPAIIHYIGTVKPWNYLSYHPQTNIWWCYLKLIPFKDFKPVGQSLKYLPKKWYLKIVKTIDYSIPAYTKRNLGRYMPMGMRIWVKEVKSGKTRKAIVANPR